MSASFPSDVQSLENQLTAGDPAEMDRDAVQSNRGCRHKAPQEMGMGVYGLCAGYR